MKIKYFILFIALISAISLLANPVNAAAHGSITELTPVGAPYETQGPIQFICTNHMSGGGEYIRPSQCTLTITRGSYSKSVTYNVPRLDNQNRDYTYTWNTDNEDFPSEGTYTITAHWTYRTSWGRTGHVTRVTTFYSVPSPWFIVAIAGFLMAIAALARKKRWWLTFYAAGAIAVVSFIISFLILTGYDNYLMGIEALNIAYIASFLGIPSNFLPPNAFIFPDPTGWSIFGIGFECSSIIEISVLAGLLLLYPGYSWSRKFKFAFIGIAITYVANLIRMLSIVYIVNIFGKTSLYFAHAIVGKLIFFAFVVVLYWYLLTRPTLGIVRDKIKSGKFE